MLYFYGIIPLNDILEISCKSGLCGPSDYKICLDIISYDLTGKRKAYFSKNKLCHRLLKNKNTVEEMQNNLNISSYKIFTADEFIKAGSFEIMITDEMRVLSEKLKDMCSLPGMYTENEVLRIWTELNNASDLIGLTEECINNLELKISKKDFKFLNVLNEINKLANSMPRWFCKGYSYNDTIYKRKIFPIST